MRKVKALRTNPKRAREDGDGEDGSAEAGGEEGQGAASPGGVWEGEGERIATAAAKAKRGTRRKNKERKIL